MNYKKQSFPFPQLVTLPKLKKTQFDLLFTHSWGENRWIYAHLKGISMKWNANNLIQDLNSDGWFHLLLKNYYSKDASKYCE